MVFLSTNFFARARGPDEFWRKRKIFKLSAHFGRRTRNCYSLAIRAVNRALMFSTFGRIQKKNDMKMLWEQRAAAGAEQHGLSFKFLNEGLIRCNVLLNRKSLADLAIWEPRTFKSIANIASARIKQDGIFKTENVQLPSNIIAKGLIK